MPDAGIAGKHHQLRRVFDQLRLRKPGHRLSKGDDRFAVGDAGTAADHYRGIIFFGKLKGKAGEILALL